MVVSVSSVSLKDWLPVDSDTLVTQEDFIFNVFGYEHPKEQVISFLKYIPLTFKDLFRVRSRRVQDAMMKR